MIIDNLRSFIFVELVILNIFRFGNLCQEEATIVGVMVE